MTIFNYNGQNITFRNENGNVYVNATEMASQFGKRPNDYLAIKSTKELMKELTDTSDNGNGDFQLIITERGGSERGGSWFHEDLAIDYAQWLSVKFRVWCNDRIKELLNHGATAINPDSLLDPDFIINLALQLKLERQQKAIALMQVKELSAKGQDYDAFTSDTNMLTMSEVAKMLFGDKGRNKLFNILRDDNVIFRGSTEPRQEFVSRGYFKLREIPISMGDKIEYKMQTMVTHSGISWLRRKYVTNQPESLLT